MNSLDKLVYMANQIGRNMAAMDRDHAAERIADHIDHFWDPRMRDLIFAHVADGAEGIDPAPLAALQLLADRRASAGG